MGEVVVSPAQPIKNFCSILDKGSRVTCAKEELDGTRNLTKRAQGEKGKIEKKKNMRFNVKWEGGFPFTNKSTGKEQLTKSTNGWKNVLISAYALPKKQVPQRRRMAQREFSCRRD